MLTPLSRTLRCRSKSSGGALRAGPVDEWGRVKSDEGNGEAGGKTIGGSSNDEGPRKGGVARPHVTPRAALGELKGGKFVPSWARVEELLPRREFGASGGDGEEEQAGLAKANMGFAWKRGGGYLVGAWELKGMPLISDEDCAGRGAGEGVDGGAGGGGGTEAVGARGTKGVGGDEDFLRHWLDEEKEGARRRVGKAGGGGGGAWGGRTMWEGEERRRRKMGLPIP